MRQRLINGIVICYPPFGGRPKLFRLTLSGSFQYLNFMVRMIDTWNDPPQPLTRSSFPTAASLRKKFHKYWWQS